MRSMLTANCRRCTALIRAPHLESGLATRRRGGVADADNRCSSPRDIACAQFVSDAAGREIT